MNREQAREWMQMALELAARGRGTTRPNPMVGSVIVKDDALIGQGFHVRAGGPHAEVHALKAAGDAARGSEMFVTLEPCCHVGRTPACTDAIIEAGVAKVWIGALDPNPKVAGKGVAALKTAGLAVELGLCEPAALALNAGYNHWMLTQRPHVILKLATSLDGKIATSSGASQWITGPEARRAVHELRGSVDGIMVGSGTAVSDDPSLTVRDVPYDGDPPTRLVVDSGLTLAPNAKLLRDDGADVIVATTASAPRDRWTALERQGATVLEVQAEEGHVDLNALLRRLGAHEPSPLRSLLVEGGSGLAAALLRSDLVDELRVFMAPLCIGGDGLSALGSLDVVALEDAHRFTLTRLTQHGDDIEMVLHRRQEAACSQD
ncbi:MAG: bifunctional diaminohydroxyphosphoribosylaminopyrimidine deaminase/5-amino-6-(5-phosphoribosylamino)uracil reductase RibD [Myxococcota bacterium]